MTLCVVERSAVVLSMTQRLKRGEVSRVGPRRVYTYCVKYRSIHDATVVEVSNGRNDWMDVNTNWRQQVVTACEGPGIAKPAPGGW